MADMYLAIGDATKHILTAPSSVALPDMAAYLTLCQDMYNYTAALGEEQLDLCSRSTEFHTFGITGAPGGELLAPSIWSISHFAQFFSMISGANNGLVVGGVPDVILASVALETAYTLNTTPLAVAAEVFDSTLLTNVSTLSWQTVRSECPPLDLACIMINYLVDDDVLLGVASAIVPGGLFCISNASNGSELYTQTDIVPFSREVHDTLLETGEYSAYHLPGYTSFTVFLKHS